MDLRVDGIWKGKRERDHGGEDAQVYEVAKIGPGAEKDNEVGNHDRGLDVIEELRGLFPN